MYSYKRLLVALDLTEMDETLFSYTSKLVDILNTDKVYFFHVAKSLELPEKVKEAYPDLMAPTDEALKEQIQKKVEEKFKSKCDYSVEIKEGNAEDKILRWADIKEIDLLVVGKKVNLKGKGTLTGKLAKTIHCSVLFVPEEAKDTVSSVLIATDCSKTSALALEEAMFFKERTGAQVVVQNSFEVPSGYHTSGKSYEEFTEIMRSNAYEDVVGFLNDNKVKEGDVEIILSHDEEDDPAERAWEVAEEKKVDLIMIGSKGRTGLASILLGSVADKMVAYNTVIPLLIVKDKKENLSFLQALLDL
ncbi:universal stress protein [Fulvivirga sediminis]|uniref:Universal stress protein n=1 Tax=Fulvivirga sediminis TaxID=2803949 RepID=A0A937JYZ3_9BACT|nr:universal stress protein [Fulvivirga sediminis]MBL3654641.1 universal stress protein [Fulvivirga sediminis]